MLLSGAIRAGVIDALVRDGAHSAADVATIAGTDTRATGVLLEALVAEGVVERVPVDREVLYRLSPLARAHLVDEGPELERAGLLHQVNKVRGWLELPEVIRTGRPRRARPRDTRTVGHGGARPGGSGRGRRALPCLRGAIGTMIDIGGAVGHLARAFSRRGVKATLFDQEDVIPLAREFLGAEADDLAFVAGDYTESLPPGPFDLVYFGNVYHIYSPETNARVTREAFAVVSPGGTIAIQDYVWGRSAEAAMFAVNMLRSTVDGGVWTEEQHPRMAERRRVRGHRDGRSRDRAGPAHPGPASPRFMKTSPRAGLERPVDPPARGRRRPM